MLRVVIAEDEALVRIGIASAIDWKAAGFELVGEAADGVEALELCERKRPEILITDIRMPRMDGLELIRRLRGKFPEIHVLVLSCYDEFAYAREAIKLGVEDYLLKMDISPETLLESLRKVAARCAAQSMKSALADERARERSGPVAVLEAFLHEIPGTDESILDPVFTHGRLVTLYALADRTRQGVPGASRGALLLDSMAGLIRDCLKHQVDNITAILPEDAIVSVLAFDPICSDKKVEAEVEKAFRTICDSLDRSLGMSVSVGASQPRQGMKMLPLSLAESKKACGMRFFSGLGRLYTFNEAALNPMEDSREMPRMTAVVEALLDCDESRLLGIISSAMKHFQDSGDDPQNIRMYFYRLLFVYIDQIESMGGDYSEALTDKTVWIERFMKTEYIEELTAHVIDLTKRVLAYIKEHRSEHRKQLVARTHAWIDANYSKEVSLDMLANYLNINTSHFCKVYRQATGHTFIERITQVRLNKAKTLLQTTDLMVYDIAANVGYQNAEYFCRLFKKTIGLTPLQFRNISQRQASATPE